jgi:hypothetical protein
MSRDILNKYKNEKEKININYLDTFLVLINNKLAYGHLKKRSQ